MSSSVPLPVPRLLRAASVVVVAAGTVMVLWGAWRTGISFDEPYHVLRLQNFLDRGWYLLDDDLVGDEVGGWVHDAFVYSPVTALVLHGLNVLVGNESAGTVSGSAEAYAVRHLGVALIGLLGVAATAALGRLVLRSWWWGLVSAAVLVALPMWTGHAMFNIKDVPTATGYTLVTLALAWLVRTVPGRGWRRALGPLAMTAGVLLAVGTRPGIWPGVAAGVVGTMVFSHVVSGERGRPFRWRWAELGLGLVPVSVLLVALYPNVFASPRWVLSSVLSSGKYAVGGHWWYVPSQVVVTMPLLLLALGVVGLVVAAAERRGRLVAGHTTAVRLLLVASQALLMPVLAILNQSHLDTGLRQLLFAAPAVSVLLALGIAGALENAGGSRRPVLVVAVAAACGLLVPTLVQGTLFPYGYSYVSVLVDAARIDPLNDSWRLSTRELAPRVPEGEFVVCSPTLEDGVTKRYMGHGGRAPAERSRDCRTDDISPLTPFRDFDVDPAAPVASTFLVVRTGPAPLGSNCTELSEVTRTRHFREQELSSLGRCDLVLNPYPAEGLVLSAEEGDDYLMGGWTGHPAEQGVRLIEPAGSLGFQLPPELATAGVDLALEADVPEGTVLRVNNQEMARLPAGRHSHRLEVPPDVAGALGDHNLVVTLLIPADGTGWVFSVSAVPREGPS